MEHQIHFEKKFYQDKKTGYWISTTCPKIRAHVWVWKYHNGNIPKGYHIHHKDENKSNNFIENLEILTSFEHLSKHASKIENKERSVKWCNEIRPLTKIWHKSEEGRKWHKEHAKIFYFGKWEAVKLICQQCNNAYETTKRSTSRFCSNNCKSMWRRQNKIDDIEKNCPVCKKIYITNKYSRSKTCGKTCGRLLLKSKIN
jgi:hypothetical protein